MLWIGQIIDRSENMKSIFLYHLDKGYEVAIRDGFKWLGLHGIVNRTTRVSIKPNLTFPEYRRGVMTNPDAIEALLRVLLEHTQFVTIVESDSGGYNRFSMSAVFRETGIADLAKKYGVRIVNMSESLATSVTMESGVGRISLLLPDILLKETDLFITMPVPKVHMNTVVSLSVKNQWGVIRNPRDRLKLHPKFADVVYSVNKALPRTISVVDGKFGLSRSGPMEGDPVNLNWMMMADDIFYSDFACCTLMGISPFSVPYLKKIFEIEGIESLDGVRMNAPLPGFMPTEPFYLKRKWTDYPGLWAFQHRWIAYIAYDSPLAGILHWILYLFRRPFYNYKEHRCTNQGNT